MVAQAPPRRRQSANEELRADFLCARIDCDGEALEVLRQEATEALDDFLEPSLRVAAELPGARPRHVLAEGTRIHGLFVRLELLGRVPRHVLRRLRASVFPDRDDVHPRLDAFTPLRKHHLAFRLHGGRLSSWAAG